MPTYDYQCQACGHKFESSQKITDDPLEVCPSCSAPKLKRGPGGGAGLLFKGKDFYHTEYGPGKDHQKKDNGGGCCPCGKSGSGGCSSS